MIGHEEGVFSVDWSPDGSYLVSGGRDRRVRIWNFAEGKELLVLEGHNRYITSVAWSPKGGYVGSSSYDGTIRIWEHGLQVDIPKHIPEVNIWWFVAILIVLTLTVVWGIKRRNDEAKKEAESS